jgi:hypothetical protein
MHPPSCWDAMPTRKQAQEGRERGREAGNRQSDRQREGSHGPVNGSDKSLDHVPSDMSQSAGTCCQWAWNWRRHLRGGVRITSRPARITNPIQPDGFSPIPSVSTCLPVPLCLCLCLCLSFSLAHAGPWLPWFLAHCPIQLIDAHFLCQFSLLFSLVIIQLPSAAVSNAIIPWWDYCRLTPCSAAMGLGSPQSRRPSTQYYTGEKGAIWPPCPLPGPLPDTEFNLSTAHGARDASINLRRARAPCCFLSAIFVTRTCC